MIKLILITLTIVLTPMLQAESLDFRDVLKRRKEIKYIKIRYFTRSNDNLANIYKRFVKDNSVISKREPMVSKTMKANPKVRNWDKIPGKQKLAVYLDVDFIDFNKVARYNKKLAQISKRIKKKLDAKRKKNPLASGLRGSFFYMASYGKFTQENPKYARIDFLQNSPVSLGLSASYYPKGGSLSYSSSLYFSYLLAAASNLGVDNVEVDPEIGGNIYAEYRLKTVKMSTYFGVDYEKFNTFSLEGVQKESDFYFDTNSVIYLTAGISRGVQIFGHDFFTKLSLSQSIVSSRTPGLSNAENTGSFSGNKVLFYLFKKLSSKFFAHSLFKYHWMSGPSDITTVRLGVGFGYIF